jgi:hypothetical protein
MVITLTAIPQNGYCFVQWQDGNTYNPRTVTVSSDMSFTAVFAPVVSTCTVTVLPNDTTMGIATGSGVYTKGDTLTIYAVAGEGFLFSHWQDGITVAQRDIVVLSDTVFIAIFEPNHTIFYTVDAVANNNTMGIVVGGGTFEEQSITTLKAIAFEEYCFVQWHDGESTNPRSITVTSDTSFVAIFQANQAVEQVESSFVSVFPNPTSGLVRIDTPDNIEIVEITTTSGRTIKKLVHCNELDFNGLPKGLYFAKITTKEKTFVCKIVYR